MIIKLKEADGIIEVEEDQGCIFGQHSQIRARVV